MLEIFNISVNSQPQEFFSWGNLVTTLLGAGFGSWSGANISLWQRKIDEHDLNFSNLKTLILITSNLRDKILNFKRDILVEKINNSNNSKFKEASAPTSNLNLSFDIELNKYHFIVDKNPTIFQLIITIENSLKSFNDTFNGHNEAAINVLYNEKTRGYLEQLETDAIKNTVNILEINTNILLYLTTLLIDTLTIYNQKYFKDKKQNFAVTVLSEDDKKLIPKDEDKNIPSSWKDGLDNWVEEKTLIDKLQDINPFFQKGAE